jgi:OOP family OmpA-OmpF porin
LRMRDEPGSTALIIGYSDTTGSASGNQKLSERRAEAVKQMLVTRHGIEADRITIEGQGGTDRFGDNSTAAGRAENRRAVIRLTIRVE